MATDLPQGSIIDPQSAKRPRTVLAGPYGHPFHPILVALPIGAWVASLGFDITSHRASEVYVYTRAAYWLVGLGVIGALLAAVFGVLDLLAIPRRSVAFDTGLVHMSLNLAVLAAFLASLFLRWGLSYADATPIGLIVLSTAALVALGVSGWLGATLVYRYGVRVADERTQAEGFAVSVPGPRGRRDTTQAH